MTARAVMRLLLASVVLCAACNTSGCGSKGPPLPPLPPPPPAVFDGGGPPSDPYAHACWQLHRLGCPEGTPADCPVVMQRADARHLTIVPVQCIIAARTHAEVQGCGGFVRCAP